MQVKFNVIIVSPLVRENFPNIGFTIPTSKNINNFEGLHIAGHLFMTQQGVVNRLNQYFN